MKKQKPFPFASFITGSRAYGPGARRSHGNLHSDTDLIVFVTHKEIGKLQAIADAPTQEDMEREKHYLQLVGGYSLRFGSLNLICVPSDEPSGPLSYQICRKGTNILKTKAKSHPVTREYAIEFFGKLRSKAGLRSKL